ncbi:MAG: hypothetical protein NPIRA01_39250 [Nitrospirales bacterium]|nr:MAG: hypothetical protein NPIRA01_39250 [Nitrospirales bacterium]
MNTYSVTNRRMNGRRGATALTVILFAAMIMLHPGAVFAQEDESPSGEAGLGIGSGLLTLVYFPVKVVYAVLGGVVGGFTYALTGGDLETAKTVWEPSFHGTYVITPAHLKGDEAVRFYGVSPYEDD